MRAKEYAKACRHSRTIAGWSLGNTDTLTSKDRSSSSQAKLTGWITMSLLRRLTVPLPSHHQHIILRKVLK